MRLNGSHKGFTLIEVLIALTLFSLVLVMIFSALHSANRSWQGANARLQNNDEQRMALMFLRRQLEQIVPLQTRDKDGAVLLFKGERDKLSFVAEMPSYHGGQGMYVWTLTTTRELDGSRHLDLRYQLLTASLDLLRFDEESKEVESLVLIEQVKDIELSYFGNEKDNEEPGWHDTWKDQLRLPGLIRLQIGPARDDNRYWPELLAAVHANMEQGQPQFMMKVIDMASEEQAVVE